MRSQGADRRLWRVDFNPQSQTERDAYKAKRAPRPALRRRMLEVDGRQYVAFSAHELIEFESDNAAIRPGHPV